MPTNKKIVIPDPHLTSSPPICLEVAVASPLPHTLTYAPPLDDSGSSPLLPGMRLLVPLQNRLVTGYLLACNGVTPATPRLKAVSAVLDAEPLFSAAMVPFFRWIADYYQYPIGEVIRTALPGGLNRHSGKRLLLTENGRVPLSSLDLTPDDQERPSFLAELLRRKELTPTVTARIWQSRGERRLVEKWLKQGWVQISAELVGGTVRIPTEICFRPLLSLTDLAGMKGVRKSERSTLEVLENLFASGTQAVPRKEITRLYRAAGPALKTLAAKGAVQMEEREVYRDLFGETPMFYPEPETLTPEQDKVVHRLLAAIQERKFLPFLLHGITGSGKTEVYLKAAQATLAQGRTVLLLVPEIALATQLENHFYSRFGNRIALLHSGLSQSEKLGQWRKISRGEIDIVIGARSAIFAPLLAPGLIIVDEEHDTAYKQEDGLRYQARDLAVLRGKMEDCLVILGSATPSVSSYHHVVRQKYELLSMTKRIEERPLPEVQVIDLRRVKTVSGRPPLFTPELFQAIRENLNRQEQSLIFLNRRGYANLMLCQDCGATVQCRQCHITMTLHKGVSQLSCHYCGFTSRSNIICANCNSGNLLGIGFGTERVEDELRHMFPDAAIARLDRDTAGDREDYLGILKKVHQGEVDILIGTQMIAKGHHFPNVTLVGIVWADAGLGLPDFRSGERTFQLLAQVTGRAGRGEKRGRVIVQTHQPEHYSIIKAQAHDYHGLFERELELRQQLNFPPFSRLINLRLQGKEELQVRAAAENLAAMARKLCPPASRLAVLGPAPAPLSKLRGMYRWQLMLKGNNLKNLHSLSRLLLTNPPPAIKSGQVKLSVDVDPENML